MAGGLAVRIKERLTMPEVAERYGFRPDRGGYIRCPFHSERTGSLKLYSGKKSGWHCFGCGRGGSVIDFVMELFSITFHQACLRLDMDFSLRLAEEKPDRKAVPAALKARRRAGREQAARELEYREMAAEHLYWWQVKQLFSPDIADAFAGYIHPLYAEAVKRLPELEHWLDENIGR